MAYKISFSPRALAEMESTIDFYAEQSECAPQKFISALREAQKTLAKTPTIFVIRYKNVRALKLKRFPYLLFYTVNEKTKTVEVRACFHGSRSPKKRP